MLSLHYQTPFPTLAMALSTVPVADIAATRRQPSACLAGNRCGPTPEIGKRREFVEAMRAMVAIARRARPAPLATRQQMLDDRMGCHRAVFPAGGARDPGPRVRFGAPGRDPGANCPPRRGACLMLGRICCFRDHVDISRAQRDGPTAASAPPTPSCVYRNRRGDATPYTREIVLYFLSRNTAPVLRRAEGADCPGSRASRPRVSARRALGGEACPGPAEPDSAAATAPGARPSHDAPRNPDAVRAARERRAFPPRARRSPAMPRNRAPERPGPGRRAGAISGCAGLQAGIPRAPPSREALPERSTPARPGARRIPADPRNRAAPAGAAPPCANVRARRPRTREVRACGGGGRRA